MSKLVAVWGTPDSGKTTVAVKLANAVYEKYISTVLVVLADIETPMLPIVCAGSKQELISLGTVLSKPEITPESVLPAIVTSKQRENYGIMGFTGTDNRNMFPEYDSAKVRELLDVLEKLADVVIVDCSSGVHDVLSETVLRDADVSIRVVSPTLKAMSFLNSQLSLYPEKLYRTGEQVVVLNNTTSSIYNPVEEMKAYLGNPHYVIPFSRGLTEQYAEGRLAEPAKERKLRELFLDMATREVAGKAPSRRLAGAEEMLDVTEITATDEMVDATILLESEGKEERDT